MLDCYPKLPNAKNRIFGMNSGTQKNMNIYKFN